MSTVSGPDASQRAGDTDVVRRNRDEAKQRESDLVKHQTRETRRLNESHYGEIERLKQDHQAQINEMHHEIQSEISEHDHRHLKDVEDIRSLHRKELQRLADENLRRDQATKSVGEGDDILKRHKDERIKQLSSDYEQKTRSLSEHFDEAMDTSRETQAQTLREERARLNQAHESEVGEIRHDNRTKIDDLTGQYGKYRAQTVQERKNGELRHMQENHKASNEKLHAVKQERTARTDSENTLREGYQTSLGETRDKYEKALEENGASTAEAERDRSKTLTARVDDKVQRLELENRDLREAQVTERIKLAGANKSEMRNLRDNMTKNIDNYREQRDEVVHNSNARSARDLASVRKDLESQLVERSRLSLAEKEEQTRIYKQSFDTLKGDYSSRGDASRSTADDRIRHILDETNEEKTRLQQQQQDGHAVSQRLKQEEMKKLREVFENDKTEAIGRVQEQMRKLETAQNEKVNLIVGKYEKQVQALKDQILRDHKNGEDSTKRLTEEMARVHKMEVDQVEATSRSRLRELTDQHREELRALNQRHEEKLDQVIGEMKRT